MSTAISYQRWSSPEQGAGDSKKRQDDLVEKYCREKGLTLLSTHIDKGVSAFRSSNAITGGLRQLRNELESGRLKTDFVLFEAFDRMSRDTALDAIELLSSIVKAGPTVVTLNDNQEYSRKSLRENPMQIMWATVQMMRSHDESLTKSRRAKSAWKSKQANALTKPMTARGPAWLELDKDNNCWTVNDEKAKVVQGIYKMAAQGKSLDGICKALNDLGVVPITGSDRWYRQQILRFLTAKSVIGIHEPKTATYEHDENDEVQVVRTNGEDILNYYPSIIDEELAEKVWALNRTRSSFKGTGRAAFITSGITKCEKCGHTMSYNVKGKYRYIICSNRRTNGCTNRKLTVYSEIESILLHELPEVLENHSPIAENTTITSLKDALVEVEAEIGRVMDAIRIRGLDASMGSVLDGLEAQRKALTLEMGQVSQRASKTFVETAIQNLISSIRSQATIPEINQNMRLVFESLVIDDTNNVIRLTLVDGSQAFIAID